MRWVAWSGLSRMGVYTAALAASVAWCNPALAWSGTISWPSYYRTGPDKHYEVLNELDRGTPVDVLSCDNGWCHITAERSNGYIEQSVIAKAEPATPQPVPQVKSDACFDSHESGYGKGDTWLYCPAAAPAPSAAPP